MAYTKKEYDNTNKAVFFQNKSEKKTEKSPDLVGTVNIEGVDHTVVLWKRQTKAGENYLAGGLSTLETKEETKAAPRAKGAELF